MRKLLGKIIFSIKPNILGIWIRCKILSRVFYEVREGKDFIYFKVPKAAGSSIKYAIGELYSTYRLRKGDKFGFTFVRNPYDRLVSFYENKINRDRVKWRFRYPRIYPRMPFEEFVRVITCIPDSRADIHFRSQDSLVPVDVDFVGYFEDLQQDFSKLCKYINKPCKKLEIVNKTKHTHFSQYYTQDLKKIVERRYRKDFERFGYSTNPKV